MLKLAEHVDITIFLLYKQKIFRNKIAIFRSGMFYDVITT